jgi:WD40 repeat protein
MNRELYELLDLPTTASDEDIRKEYKKLAIKYHPDKNKESNATEMFQKISNAFQVLSDPDKRYVYDQFGLNGIYNFKSNIDVLKGHKYAVCCIAINNDGSIIVSGGYDNTIIIWNNNIPIKKLVGHKSTINSIAMDSTKIVSGSADKTIRIWDLKYGDCLQVLEGHKSVVNSIVITPTSIISGGWDGKIIVWNNVGDRYVEEQVIQSSNMQVYSIAISNDFNWIISGGWDNTIKLHNLSTSETIVLEGHPNQINSVAISDSQKWIASGSTDGSIIVWKKLGEFNYEKTIVLNGHTQSVNSLAILNDKYIISGSWDKTVKLWDIEKRSYINMNYKFDSIWGITISKNKKWLAICSWDSNVYLLSLCKQYIKDKSKNIVNDSIQPTVEIDIRHTFAKICIK